MNNSFRVNFGGWMSILGGASLAAAHSIDFFAGGSPTLGKTIVFIAHLITVFSFIAIHEAQGSKNRLLGSLGMVFAVIGSVIVTAIVIVEIAGTTGTSVEQVFQSPVASLIYSYGPLLFILGMILVGVSVIKNKVLSWFGGTMLVVGTIVFALGTLAGSFEALITTLGSILTAIGFIALGRQLITLK